MLLDKEIILDKLEKERRILVSQGRLGAEHVLVHHAIAVIEGMTGQQNIVLCKDCEHFVELDGYTICAMLGGYYGVKKPEEFCSDGRRKDEP